MAGRKRKVVASSVQVPSWAEEKMRAWKEWVGPIQERFSGVLRRELGLTKAAADEAAFHLTDWSEELYLLHDLFEHPKKRTDREVRDALMGFVAHASHHVAAAHRAIMDLPVTDVFGIGAVKGTGRGVRKPGEPYPERRFQRSRRRRKATDDRPVSATRKSAKRQRPKRTAKRPPAS
jgi:hypothetical protein